MLVFDIESNGLLPQMDRIHCLVIKDTETGEVSRYNSAGTAGRLWEGVERLRTADVIVGHNIIGFDIPGIQIVYPKWAPEGRVIDTLILSRLAYPDLKKLDFAARAKGLDLPGWMTGSHALKAWGVRLKFPKDDYSDRMKAKGLDPWAKWNQDMEDYCVTDVELTEELLNRASARLPLDSEAVSLEMGVQQIIQLQVNRGFRLNETKMAQLHASLVDHKLRLNEELRAIFPPFYMRDGARDFKPKRPNKTMGYVAGAPLCKVKMTDFNPGSRAHISHRLMALRGWQPTAWGKDGKPTVDEEVLEALPWPEAQTISEYLMVVKRLGQLFEGKGSVAKFIRNGFIHGEVNTLGTRTGRMSHSKPNVAQTPSVKKGTDGAVLMGGDGGYGFEFRDLYEARPGYVLVGCDADALELVGLAHFMARWDKGAYAKAVQQGDKSQGTDPHSVNQRALGFLSRDNAKTWFYAFIYGAGMPKLGSIVYEDMDDASKEEFGEPDVTRLAMLGKQSKARIAKGLPALGKFVEAAQKAAKGRGHLVGLDGRKLDSPSAHSAPNTVLQSAGALIMKKALVIAAESAGARWVMGDEWAFVANVHDEFQAEARPAIAEELGQVMADSITAAAESFNFRCPLSGSYKVGQSWAHTH